MYFWYCENKFFLYLKPNFAILANQNSLCAYTHMYVDMSKCYPRQI